MKEMKRNPLIPFLLIAILGIGLTFFLSMKGLKDEDKIASGGEEQKQRDSECDAEELYKAKLSELTGKTMRRRRSCIKGVGDKLEVADIKKKNSRRRQRMPAADPE
ncbi:cytochrome c [Bacillus pumilus]|nr:cytochrome c [Bacillus pumilus]